MSVSENIEITPDKHKNEELSNSFYSHSSFFIKLSVYMREIRHIYIS